jgi:adenine-specific DNA-methyltransferase
VLKAIALNEAVDDRRLEANGKLNPKTKSTQGQYMTPRPVAQFMASLFVQQDIGEVRLLDAGAGVGSLTAAFVKEFCSRQTRIKRIAPTAYETDHIMVGYLQHTFEDCEHVCRQAGIAFTPQLVEQDFIAAGAEQLFMGSQTSGQFTHAILNPPYKKIHSDSDHRRLLRSIGVETVNLYTGFLAVAIKLLEPGGELVAIVPRSFCNGPYYRPFRELLLAEMALKAIHVFESRTHAFKDDEVLQENIIFHAVKGQLQGQVRLSLSVDADFAHMSSRVVDFARIVSPDDAERFIHLAVSEDDQQYVERMTALPCTLKDLSIDASTGPVVDFRLADYLRDDPQPNTFPLIYPVHCRNHFVTWPLPESRKPNAITNDQPVLKWLYPNGHYTVVRRFSSKEERRRVVATIHDPCRVPGEHIGFENHLNVFHRNRQGLTPELARGLAIYLNSTLYDVCFRQFNGHTQVNVKDLYNLRYPDLATLEKLGKYVDDDASPSQDDIDAWIDKELP